MTSWFRIEGPYAKVLLDGLRARHRKGQSLHVDVVNKLASPPPLGVAPDPAVIQGVRDRLREQVFGEGPERTETQSRRALGAFLHDEAGISTSDAGQPAVWNYLALVLLPDVMVRTGANLATDPHFVARDLTRHRLARYWRRDLVLGEWARGRGDLAEDEMVQLTERVALARNVRLIRLMCEFIEREPSRGREQLTRDFTRFVTARTGAVLMDALSDDHLREILAEEFDRARRTSAPTA